MHIKKYEVKTISEAMERIRKDLGPDAVILSSRRIGSGRASRIEIVAAIDRYGGSGSEEATVLSRDRDQEEEKGVSPGNDPDSWRRIDVRLDEMNENLLLLMASLAEHGKTGGFGFSPLYRMLVSRGISPRSALKLEETLKGVVPGPDEPGQRNHSEALERVISESIASTCPPGGRKKRIAAFVGPAGEGKTTTLAKLAADLRYREKQTLGIITMDTFRIGALQQLKIYGDIMGVPVVSMGEKDSFEGALRQFDHMDRVFVDTPGKSRDDDNHIKRLRECLSGDVPVETKLVLSATTGTESMMDAVRRFRDVGYDHIIMTKVDDARNYGCIFDVIHGAERPVSHVTTGQQVPRDIRAMTPEKIARLIVNQAIPRH